MVPWLAPVHQALVFPDGLSFELPEEQEHCIRSWVQKRAGFWPTFKVCAGDSETLSHAETGTVRDGTNVDACGLRKL